MKTSPRGRQSSSGRVWCCAAMVILVIIATFVLIKTAFSNVTKRKEDSNSICYSSPKWYKQEDAAVHCTAGQQQRSQTLQLLSDISSALKNTSSIHWLCYGTLWGVIRERRLLEYDKDGDICALDIKESEVIKLIKSLPGEVYYTQTFTMFNVWRELAEVGITLYENSNIMNDNTNEKKILRLGHDRNFVSRDCKVEAFPQRFVAPPLPRKLLGGVPFPVPRENFEIQMYIYPDDWSQVVKPLGCS